MSTINCSPHPHEEFRPENRCSRTPPNPPHRQMQPTPFPQKHLPTQNLHPEPPHHRADCDASAAVCAVVWRFWEMIFFRSLPSLPYTLALGLQTDESFDFCKKKGVVFFSRTCRGGSLLLTTILWARRWRRSGGVEVEMRRQSITTPAQPPLPPPSTSTPPRRHASAAVCAVVWRFWVEVMMAGWR